MQSTIALVQTVTRAHLAGDSAARPLSYAAVQAAWAAVPDPRRAQGRRFSLPAILTLVVAALLANLPRSKRLRSGVPVSGWPSNRRSASPTAARPINRP